MRMKRRRPWEICDDNVDNLKPHGVLSIPWKNQCNLWCLETLLKQKIWYLKRHPVHYVDVNNENDTAIRVNLHPAILA